MSVSEFERHQLFQWFEEAMGPERAATMMEVIPPVSWTNIVTKDHLDSKVNALEARVTGEIARQGRTIFFAVLGSTATLAGIVLAAMRLG
jgi:hypothetical protein